MDIALTLRPAPTTHPGSVRTWLTVEQLTSLGCKGLFQRRSSRKRKANDQAIRRRNKHMDTIDTRIFIQPQSQKKFQFWLFSSNRKLCRDHVLFGKQGWHSPTWLTGPAFPGDKFHWGGFPLPGNHYEVQPEVPSVINVTAYLSQLHCECQKIKTTQRLPRRKRLNVHYIHTMQFCEFLKLKKKNCENH